MGDWLVSIAGTPQGAQLATLLALMSAIAHASFGALQKGNVDPWTSRGVIDGWLAIISAPVALFLVPWPDGRMWIILIGAVMIHLGYKLAMALAYERAAYTVVYPIVRGSGPVVTVAAATVIFHEHFALIQWLGVVCLSGGILLVAVRNMIDEKLDPKGLRIGLIWAAIGGATVALYTVYDAWGIRQSADPFTFLAWWFFLAAFDMPVIAAIRWRNLSVKPAVGPLMLRGICGAFIGWISFGGVMLATRIDKVGEAAVLRETSPVFAALIGWLFLGEKVGWQRSMFIALIAIGAVIVEFGA